MVASRGQPLIPVTVLVCTRNRAAILEEGLFSIIADQAASGRELVVVDNGSTDNTAAVVSELARTAPFPVRYVHEPVAGHSLARNTGIRESSGELVLFTDDDTLVEKGWTDALVAPFTDPAVGVVGGRILPQWPSEPPVWLTGLAAELLAIKDLGDAPRELSGGEMPIGANMAIRRRLLGDDPFDTSTGNRDGEVAGYDEVALIDRLSRSHQVAYTPAAVVRHRVARARMTRASIRRAALHNGFGQTRYERAIGRRHGWPAAVLGSLQWSARATLRRLRNNRRAELSPAEAEWEFAFYRRLGSELDAATWRSASLNSWLMNHLA
ncbi:MAG: glucosyl-dolichyl phosphate glucuronosyltransferase [Chloroflexota bacterium]|nr:glucosyl-dolichyl phosphate glucuronosyltransferase [Chloroflexota bacterium]